MTVADSGPIITFARAGQLDLLRQTMEELIIPDAVYEEVVIRGQGRPGSAEVAQAEWIRRQRVRNVAALAQFPSSLRSGQRESTLLAQELGTRLLIDEEQGRKEAASRGIEVNGTLGVLAEAKQRGLIAQVRPIIKAMRSATYRIGDEVLYEFS